MLASQGMHMEIILKIQSGVLIGTGTKFLEHKDAHKVFNKGVGKNISFLLPLLLSSRLDDLLLGIYIFNFRTKFLF